MLELRNPHSVLAALQRRPRDVQRVTIAAGGGSHAWGQVVEAAQAAGVVVARAGPGDDRPDRGAGSRRGDRQGDRPGHRPGGRSDRSGGPKERREGGSLAQVLPLQGVTVEALFTDVPARGLWLALDRIQDPRNVGSIFRSAAFFGVRGVLLTHDQSAPLTGVTYDTASGGLESVQFALGTNLRQGLEAAKRAGLWVLGCAEEAPQPVDRVDRQRAWLVVVGNEETGLRRLTRESCDDVCSIPARGDVGSLNAAVATAVVLSHLATEAPA